MEPATIVQIGLAVVILASFFITYLSTKTWPVSQVVLVYLIFLMGGLYWYMSAATLKTHEYWRQRFNQLEEDVAQTEAENIALQSGTDDQAILDRLQRDNLDATNGIKETLRQLAKIRFERGRVWRNVQPSGGSPDSFTVAVPQPKPHNLVEGDVVYAFEEGLAADSNYIGEFKVTGTTEDTVTLATTNPMDDVQAQQLSNSRKPWDMYAKMPVDRHDLFEGYDATALASLFPSEVEEATLSEYLRTGEEALPTDPPDRIRGYTADGVLATEQDEQAGRVTQRRYHRRLRDYEYLFDEKHQAQVINEDIIAQLQKDQLHLEKALRQAKEEQAKREDIVANLQADLEKFQSDADYAKAHLATLEIYQARLDQMLAENRAAVNKLAAQLAQVQLSLAREINARSGQPASATAATINGN